MDEIVVESKLQTPTLGESQFTADNQLQTKMDIGQMLGLKNPLQSEFNRELDYIIDSLSEKGKTSRADMIKSLRQIEHKIGMPKFASGESWVGRIYVYLRARATYDNAKQTFRAYK